MKARARINSHLRLLLVSSVAGLAFSLLATPLCGVASCATWAPPTQLNIDDGYDDSVVGIDVDEDGVVWVVWDGRGPVAHDREIFYTRYVSGEWEEQRKVHRNNTIDDIHPKISIGKDGVPWVIWKSGFDVSNWNILVSRWGGTEWGAPDTLASGISIFASFQLAAWGCDNAIAVWPNHPEEGPKDWEIHLRRYADSGWGPTERLEFPNMEDSRPYAVFTAEDSPWIFWDSRPPDWGLHDIYYSRMDAGEWSPPALVEPDLTAGTKPFATNTPSGEPWVFWPGEYMTDLANGEVFCAMSENDSWEFLGAVNLPDEGDPRRDIGADCHGGTDRWPVVVWTTVLRPDGPPYLDIRFSAWDGQGWTPQESVPMYQPPELGEDSYPRVAVDDDGRLWLAWLKADEGPDYDKDVYVTYSDDALPVVVHGCSTKLVEGGGVELGWEVSGKVGSGVFNVYRLEASAESEAMGRAIPEEAVRVNAEGIPEAGTMRYLDASAQDGVEFCYWIEREGEGGDRKSYRVGCAELPRGVSLGAIRKVHPIPAMGAVSVDYELQIGGRVSFEVFDALGRLVEVVDLGSRSPGVYSGNEGFRWSGASVDGGEVPSGVYLVRMAVGGKQVSEGKVVLIRP